MLRRSLAFELLPQEASIAQTWGMDDVRCGYPELSDSVPMGVLLVVMVIELLSLS